MASGEFSALLDLLAILGCDWEFYLSPQQIPRSVIPPCWENSSAPGGIYNQISPLLKKPGLPKSDLANFRPISNLNTIGKILERPALSRFFPHFKISQFFSVTVCLSQVSFYWDCLAKTNKWYHGNHWLRKNYNSPCWISSAFDTLDHITLLHRLQHTFSLSG